MESKVSLDGGISWLNMGDLTISSNLCNGIDVIGSDQSTAYLVYSTRDNYPDFKTYYYRSNGRRYWTDGYDVTGYNQNYVGGNPSIASSTNRFHISFNTNNADGPFHGDAKVRDKFNSNWEATQIIMITT